MRKLKNNRLFFAVLFIMGIAPAYADITHYINSNVGDRASGLAGAYTAVSDDSSGCFYNPAGIVLAPANKFSASVNALSTSTKVYKDVMNKASGGTMDWEQESFNLLPNYFGIVQKFGPGMAGFSYAVPDAIQMRQQQTFTGIRVYDGATPINIDNYTIDINEYDKTYLFGPSYALKISDSMSVGGTLYYYYHDFERIFNQFIQTEGGEEAITNFHSTQTEHGIKPVLGFMWDPMDNLSLGLSVSKLWILSSDADVQTIYNFNEGDPADFGYDKQSYDDKDKFPLSIAFGLAWFYSPSLLFSFDTKYFESAGDKESVLNIALATEYYPVESFAVRAGFYTDGSNAPDVTTSSEAIFDQIDIYGLCLSGTLFSGKSSVSFGVDWSFGNGDSQPIASDSAPYNVHDVEYNNLTFHLSTSFTY